MLRNGAWSAITPNGDAAATIERCLRQEKVFHPDGAIRNRDGHPVHSAAVEALPLAALGYPDASRERAMRLPALLLTVLNDLHDQQLELAHATAAAATVVCLLPAALAGDEETRPRFAAAWARSDWRDVAYRLQLVPSSPDGAYAVLNDLRGQMDPLRMPYVLLLAADSLLDPDELSRELALGRVFSDKAPNGFVPAEGAGGLLLVHSGFAEAVPLVGLSRLGLANRATRESDRGDKGKVDSATLSACMNEAMAAVEVAAGDVGAVLADTDHRAQRGMEVIQSMGRILPALDPLAQRISPMEYAGCFGAAADLLHLALAAEMAASGERATMALSLGGDRQTAAVVILPDQG